jgi:predicted DNA binding CopG/RHH family protein
MSRGTTLRNVRVPDELWDAAKAKADAEGRNVSEVVRTLLEKWLRSMP